jgi:hypothetical protein
MKGLRVRPQILKLLEKSRKTFQHLGISYNFLLLFEEQRKVYCTAHHSWEDAE